MSILTADVVSHYAHQDNEPTPYIENHYGYKYDEYVIVENDNIISMYTPAIHGDMWLDARAKFLYLFNIEKRAVKLVGRVFM